MLGRSALYSLLATIFVLSMWHRFEGHTSMPQCFSFRGSAPPLPTSPPLGAEGFSAEEDPLLLQRGLELLPVGAGLTIGLLGLTARQWGPYCGCNRCCCRRIRPSSKSSGLVVPVQSRDAATLPLTPRSAHGSAANSPFAMWQEEQLAAQEMLLPKTPKPLRLKMTITSRSCPENMNLLGLPPEDQEQEIERRQKRAGTAKSLPLGFVTRPGIEINTAQGDTAGLERTEGQPKLSSNFSDLSRTPCGGLEFRQVSDPFSDCAPMAPALSEPLPAQAEETTQFSSPSQPPPNRTSTPTSPASPTRKLTQAWLTRVRELAESKFDHFAKGELTRADVLTALERLERAGIRLGLSTDDRERFFYLIAEAPSSWPPSFPGFTGQAQVPLSVKKETFAKAVAKTAEVAKSLDGLTLQQLRDTLFFAFDSLDSDRDSVLRPSEVSAALRFLGVGTNLSKEAHGWLRVFLGTQEEGLRAEALDPAAWRGGSLLERWGAALRSAWEEQSQRRNLHKLGPLLASMSAHGKVAMEEAMIAIQRIADEAFLTAAAATGQKPLPPTANDAADVSDDVHGLSGVQKALTALFENADELVDALELGSDLAATLLALQAIARELAGVDTWSNVQLSNLTPFLVFLGAGSLHVAQEVAQLRPKDLAIEESLLYVRVFQRHGLTLSAFRRLLDGTNGRWERPRAGSALEGLQEQGRLCAIVRGSCSLNSDQAGQGPSSSIGSGTVVGALLAPDQSPWKAVQLQANEGLLCMSWNCHELRTFLETDEEISQCLAAVLAEGLPALSEALRVKPTEVDDPFHLDSGPESDQAQDTSVIRSAFRAVARSDWQSVEERDVQSILEVLAQDLFQREDSNFAGEEAVRRLRVLLSQDGAPRSLNLDAFEALLGPFAEGLEALGTLSIRQLGDILTYALEHFDRNRDGRISLQEFDSASKSLGLQLSPDAQRAVFLFLDADGDGFLTIPDLQPMSATGVKSEDNVKTTSGPLDKLFSNGIPSLARLTEAFQEAMREQWKRKGVDKVQGHVQGLLEAVPETLQTDSPLAVVDAFLKRFAGIAGAGGLQDILGLVLDTAAMGTALQRLGREICGLDNWADLDPSTVAPLLIFVGLSAVYMARVDLAKNQVTSLSEDEALLYTQVFQRHGMSLHEYQRLLSQGGARCEGAEGPLKITGGGSTGLLGFVVRGRCVVEDGVPGMSGVPAVLSSGSSFGEVAFLRGAGKLSDTYSGTGPRRAADADLDQTVQLSPGARAICWDAAELMPFLARKGPIARKLRAVLAESAAAKLLWATPLK